MSRPTVKTLDLVWARDNSSCFLCVQPLTRGAGDYSVHHRRPRGMGGSKDPATNSPANLLLLCGSGTTGCHGLVEANRAWALEKGLVVSQGRDPADVEITVRPLFPVRLGSDGRKGDVIFGTLVWRQSRLLARLAEDKSASNGSQADQAGA